MMNRELESYLIMPKPWIGKGMSNQ